VLYEHGLGMDKDAAKSVEWFMKAAAQGIPQATYNVANAYRAGIGVDRNYEKALALYKEAALKGYGPAAHNVGAMSGNGEGTPQSDAEAYRWLLLASKLGVDSDVSYREKFRALLTKASEYQIEGSVEIMLKQISAPSVSATRSENL
jgi:TPR repeat protein